jgi:hypothetical protein
MAINNQDQPLITIKILFDGLDTERGELLLASFTSPDLQNVSFDTYGTMESRLGSDVLCVCLDFANGYMDDDRLDDSTFSVPSPIYVLGRHDDDALGGLLINVTEYGAWQGQTENLSQLDPSYPNQDRLFSPMYFNGEKGGSVQAVWVDEVDIDDPTTWIYHGSCLYMTRRGMVPHIHVGGDTPSLSAGGTISQIITVAPMTVQFYSTHSFSDMDIIRIRGLTESDWSGAPTWYAEVQGHDFYVKVASPGEVNLYDMNMQPFGNPGVGVGVPLSSGGALRSTDISTSLIPMPRGIYSTTAAVRGYPARWIDPNGDMTNSYTDWPDEDITSDWPQYMTYIGVGPGSRDDNQLASRMLAYGFELDPDRIDYSALGTPYNFLKDDPTTGNTEAAADTNPALDGGYFYASRGDGDKVVRVIEHMGFLIVFKQFKTIVYTGEIGQFFRVEKVYNVGAVSYDGVVRVGNEIYFWSFDGPRKLSLTDTYADLIEGMVGQYVIQKVRGAVTRYLPNVVGRHERLSRRVVWFYTVSGTTNNAALVHYYPEAGRETWSYFAGQYTNCQYLAEYFDPYTLTQKYYYTGTNATDDFYKVNRIYEANVGNADIFRPVIDFAGSDRDEITTYYVTRWFDAGEPIEVIRALDLTILAGEKGLQNTKFYIGWDYADDWYEMDVAIRPLAGSAGKWNFGFWNAGYWNESARASLQLRATGRGRIFRIKITATTAPIGIHGLVLNVSRKGTR